MKYREFFQLQNCDNKLVWLGQSPGTKISKKQQCVCLAALRVKRWSQSKGVYKGQLIAYATGVKEHQ